MTKAKTDGLRQRLAQYYARPELERFWEQTEADAIGGCILWSGVLSVYGYGVFRLAQRKVIGAHRYAYQAAKGEIPEGLVLRHKCDVPACVNPDHLIVGTQKQNIGDAVSRGRHCHGVRHGNAKMNDDIVREIRGSRDTSTDVAARYGIAPVPVRAVRQRRLWDHVDG